MILQVPKLVGMTMENWGRGKTTNPTILHTPDLKTKKNLGKFMRHQRKSYKPVGLYYATILVRPALN